MRMLPHLLAAGKPKCKLHIFKEMTYNYRACSACSISSLSLSVLAVHVEAFWAMCWPLSWAWAFQCR